VITQNGVQYAYPVHTIHFKDQSEPDGVRAQTLLDTVPGRQR